MSLFSFQRAEAFASYTSGLKSICVTHFWVSLFLISQPWESSCLSQFLQESQAFLSTHFSEFQVLFSARFGARFLPQSVSEGQAFFQLFFQSFKFAFSSEEPRTLPLSRFSGQHFFRFFYQATSVCLSSASVPSWGRCIREPPWPVKLFLAES